MSLSAKTYWESVGGNLYSLVDENTEHKDHVCCVEFENSDRTWSVVYMDRPLSAFELEGLMNLLEKL